MVQVLQETFTDTWMTRKASKAVDTCVQATESHSMSPLTGGTLMPSSHRHPH